MDTYGSNGGNSQTDSYLVRGTDCRWQDCRWCFLFNLRLILDDENETAVAQTRGLDIFHYHASVRDIRQRADHRTFRLDLTVKGWILATAAFRWCCPWVLRLVLICRHPQRVIPGGQIELESVWIRFSSSLNPCGWRGGMARLRTGLRFNDLSRKRRVHGDDGMFEQRGN